jgi:fructose-1-phosphate kinase PfkB-like protein
MKKEQMNDSMAPKGPFLLVTLNPTFQKTLVFEHLRTGEVNRAEEQYYDVAGKALNATRILGQLGEEALHVTHAGGPERERYLAMCAEAAVPTVAVPAGEYIRTCTTTLDHHTGEVTELVEPASPVAPATGDEILTVCSDRLADFGTFVFAGSMAPGYPAELPGRLISAARKAGLFVLADFRGEELKKTLQNPPDELPNIVKINLVEFAQTFFFGGADGLGEHTADPAVLEKAARHMQLLRKQGVEVVITRGSQPTLVLGEDGALRHIPTVSLEAVNTIGCGDAFAAGLLAEMAASSSLEDSIERAHAVAAMNATTVRPGTIRP